MGWFLVSVVIKHEILRVDSSELYDKLRNRECIRDILEDGRTLHIDKAEVEDCLLICEDYIPNEILKNLED